MVLSISYVFPACGRHGTQEKRVPGNNLETIPSAVGNTPIREVTWKNNKYF